jgi:non-ribosomal peptide synthase protein (TIGR01720 family)
MSEDLDMSRSVGWFTSIYPVLLTLKTSGRDWEPGESLKSIKEQLRAVPGHGIGYGVLRYLSPDSEVRDKLRQMPPANILFNYLGQLDQPLQDSGIFEPAQESAGASSALENRPQYALAINSMVMGGRLKTTCGYDPRLYAHHTIETLARLYLQSLRELIAHCRSKDAGGYTPSDFPLAAIEQKELDRIAYMLDERSPVQSSFDY